MAFFTAQQLFGDGSGSPGDPGWVPIALTAPPTFSVNNRGIAFGEQLTSAIANRPHYALALNDDDLNTRLALFETGGLDAAYDQGALAVDGGGRIINKDGGAVETVSANATQYGDDKANAHFRANMFGDTTPGVGFDAQSGPTSTAAASFLARYNTALLLGGSGLFNPAVGTLNPGGADATMVRLTGPSVFHTGGLSGIALRGTDLIEIYDAATPNTNGLYVPHTLGGTNADMILRRLDGTSPTFTSTTACNVRLHRSSLMADYNLGGIGTLGRAAAALGGNTFHDELLALLSNDIDSYLGTGADAAIKFGIKDTAGVVSAPTMLTTTGRRRSTASSGTLPSANRDTEMRGYGGFVHDITDVSGAAAGSHEVGSIFKDVLDGATARSAMENWQRITETTVLGIGASVNGTFAAPSGRVILPDSDGTPVAPTGLLKWTWSLAVLPGITVIEMLTGANAGQFYLLQYVELTGASNVDPVADEIRLVDMDGNAASLPTAGNFTFRFISRDLYAAKMPPTEIFSTPESGVVSGETVTYANVLTPQRATADNVRTVGIVGKMAGGVAIGGSGVAGDYYLSEQWVINEDGDFYTNGLVRADSLAMTGTSRTVSIAQADVTINHHLLNGYPEEDGTGSPGWRWDQANGWWECLVANGILYFPILFTGRLMTTELQVFNANTGNHDVIAGLQSVEPDWGTPSNAPTFTLSNADSNFGANVWSELSINHSLGTGTVISLSTRSYAIRVEGESIGDRVRALRHSVRFTTIGPGGIGS